MKHRHALNARIAAPSITRSRVRLAMSSVVAITFALSAAAPASAAPLTKDEAKCLASKLKTAGKLAQKQLTCHSKASKKGETVDPTCLDKAKAGFDKNFTKAETKGGCVTTGDDFQVERLTDGSTNIVAHALAPTVAESKCTSAKLKTAGKRAAAMLKSHSKAIKKGSTEKLPGDVAKADEKFNSGFTKAETKGSCQTTGDAEDVAESVDAGLDGVLGRLAAVTYETVNIPSGAEPAETPGSGATDASGYPKIVTQFGTSAVNLNNATYTRFYYQPDEVQPDAILILIPGFEGGAHSFKIVAENLVGRAIEEGTRLEVWAFDRRGHQLEDLEGQDIAEAEQDGALLLDYYFGDELGLTLDARLTRRAEFHDAKADTAFIGNWTYNVIAQDVDAVVEAAVLAAANGNVFLGGHSAGTGFTARYAATDFDTSAPGVEAGYAKLRGLVLLEGGGGSSAGTPPDADMLDRIEDKADGGQFFAIRDNAPRCVDGTPCTMATEAVDCAGKGREKCTDTIDAYAVVTGLLNPRVLAAGEITAIQAITDPNTGENLVGVDQGAPGNNAIEVVPDLAALAALGDGTALGGLGAFVDDDGFIAAFATFVASSAGAEGLVVGGLTTWQSITDPPMPLTVVPDNGPPPTAGFDAWGEEVEVVRMDRFIDTFYSGASNFTDWYYPSGGLGTTGGLPSLDSSALSIGRARPDIDNVTEAANIDIPVICFGGSNGLTRVGASYLSFASSIGTCAAPTCDGTPRVVDELLPSEAFPTYGNTAGGFEVVIIEGIAHVDVGVGEDNSENVLAPPLLDFIKANMQ